MQSTGVEGESGDFASWLAAREPALHRLATLLTGDPYAGHALLRPALARLLLDWQRIGAADAEHRGRELLLAQHRTTWDRRASEAARIRLAEEYDGADAAAWALVGSLPARERAIVVVRHYEGLDDAETGRLLRLTRGLVQAEDREVLTALRLQLDRQRVRHPDRALLLGDPAEVLAETLRAHAEEATYVPSDPDQVAADAATTRGRRRWTTVAAVVAAAVVVTVLVALVDPPPATRAGPATSPPAAVAPPGALDRPGADGPPGVPYLVGDVLFAADGSRVSLPVAHPRSATPFQGDVWVTELYYDVNDTLRRIDADGTQVGKWATSGDPVVRSDGQRLAWVELNDAGSRIHVEPRSDLVKLGDPSTQDVGEPIWLVGALGDRVVFNGTHAGGAWVTDLRSRPHRIPGLALARGVDPDTGAVSGTSDHGDGVVLDPDTGDVRWRSATWRPEAFSPDGRHLVAFTGTRDAVQHAILDARTGRAVAVINDSGGGPGSVLDLRWEDDEHVLLLVTAQGRSALLRADLSGKVTTAAPTLPSDEVGGSAYQFAVR